MAIKVGNTTVINNSRVLQNVSGLKTIGGASILGSGDIAVGGAPVRAVNRVSNAGMETLGSSTYDRLYIGMTMWRYGRTLSWTGSGVGAYHASNYVGNVSYDLVAPTGGTMVANYSDTIGYDVYIYLGAGRGISTTQGASQCPHFWGIYVEFEN